METAFENDVELEGELVDAEENQEEELEDVLEAAEEEQAKEIIREKATRAVRVPRTKARRQLTEDRDQSVADFLNQIGSGADSMKIILNRKFPKIWVDPGTGTSHQIEGRLGTYDEPITDEDIQEQHGGGTYAIAVQVPNDRGKYVYIPGGHKTFKISGPPNVKGIIAQGETKAPNGESPDAVKLAFGAMREVMNRKGDHDPMMATLIENMQTEARELRKDLASKEERLLRVITQKPESSHSERLLEAMMGGESVRIQALNATHESELRAVRERALFDADRQFAVLRDQIEDLKRTHDREVTNLTRTHDAQLKQTETLHLASTKSLEREMRHLADLLTEAKTELVALRAQKVKSPMEMISEVSAFREAIQDLGGGGEDAAPTSTLEKIFAGVAPILDGVGRRFAEGGPPAIMAPPVPAEEFPVGQPVRRADGKVVVRQPDGTLAEVRRKKKPTVEVAGKQVELDPETVKNAIRFMEAVVGKQDPQTFASAIRHTIPPSIQEALAGPKGVDYFLDQVVQLEPSSPLATVSGRQWLREVAKHIFV